MVLRNFQASLVVSSLILLTYLSNCKCNSINTNTTATSDAETTSGTTKTTLNKNYESTESTSNLESATSVLNNPSGLNETNNNTNLLKDLNESLMIQMCTHTISSIPVDSSLFLTAQLMCKLNKELSLLNKGSYTSNNLQSTSISSQNEVTPTATVNTKSGQDYDDLSLEDYDKRLPPKLNEDITLPNGTIIHIDKPVVVRVYIFLRSIRGVDEIDEKVTVDMDLFLFWFDGNIRNELRSKGKNIKTRFSEHEPVLRSMKKSVEDKIWIPDVLFEEVEKVNRPRVLDNGGQVILLYSDYGAPFLRLRMRVTLDCGMDFSRYPADTQKCEFHLRSSSYKNNDVQLTWWKKVAHGVYLGETSDPNFDFQVTGVDEYDKNVDIGPESPEVRKSSHLKFELWIRRKMSYHLIQTYLPSVFFIIVTWLVYLIPPRMVEARIGVTMTTLLTMTSMFSSIRESSPIVGYVKAIDIWMVNCVFFIFLTLIALTLGACARAIKGRLKRKQDESTESQEKLRRVHLKIKLWNICEVFLEKYMVFALFTLFVLFVFLYWFWLLNDSSEYLKWAPNSTYNRID